jgi:signal transduction histidine kinase
VAAKRSNAARPFTRGISSVERQVALENLGTESWHVRLKAARALTSLAQPEDLQALLAAQASETVSYVRKALDSGIRRVRREIEEARAIDAESIPPSVMRQVHAKAVEDVTRTLLHEIEAIAGAIALSASRDVPNYAQSGTKTQVDRLEKQLEGIARLKAAAAAPKFTQFSLGSWVKELVAEEADDDGLTISLVGPENLVVEGDPKLLRLAVCNGLRNAIEAVQELPLELDDGAARIVVSWDANDVECWVAIKDDGSGLSAAPTDALPIGRTTKVGHGGLGLMTAKQAMDSHGGSVSLSPGAQGGALFEVRWFGP